MRPFRRIFTARRVLFLALLLTASFLLLGARATVLLWMGVAEVGAYFAYLNGMESLSDLHAIEGRTNGRRTIAVGNLRREVVRGLIAINFITIGLMVLLGYTAVAVPGLILGSAGMALNSYLDRRDRIYLLQHGLQPRDAEGKFVSAKDEK
jgi:hypothetical protein